MTGYRWLLLAALVGASLLVGFEAGRASATPRPSAVAIPAGVSAPDPRATSSRTDPPMTEAPSYPVTVPSPTATAGRSPQPTPPGASVSGLASWYAAGPGLYAALPGPWRPHRRLLVCGPDGECVGGIPVVTSCGCPGGRVVDLSRGLFMRFAPLSQGLVRVTMVVFG